MNHDNKKLRINERIHAKQIRLIGANGHQFGVVSLSEALAEAEKAELDLVEVSPQSDPPVCKIMDYGKYIYEQTKKRAEARKKQKTVLVKELKYRPNIEDADYQVRLRRIKEFITEGNKVKITMRFRGREAAHTEFGLRVLERIQKDISDIATVEQAPQFEGKQVIMLLAPLRKGKA